MASKVKADLSEFFRLAQPARPPCRIGFALTQLVEQEAINLTAACKADKGIINSGAIRKWLADRGHDVSVSAITNHRNGVCSCAREA